MITINKANPTSGEITSSLTGATDAAGLHFDGAAGNIDFTPPDLGTKFSIEFIIQADSWGRNQYLIDFGTGGRFFISSESGDSYNLGVFSAAAAGTSSFGVKVLDDLKVHHLVVTVDGTSAILYDNGNQVGTATIDSPNIDGCSAAKLGANFPADDLFFNGTYYRCRFWNKTLSQPEVTATYENATVPFADQYGSQTSLVDAAASVFTSGTYSWVADGSNTIANVSNTLAITYVNNASGAYNYLRNASDLTTDLTVGKKYRLTVDAKYAGGSSGSRLRLNDGVNNSYSVNLTTSLVNYTFEFTAQTPTGAAGYLQLDAMAASNVVTIDNWYLREIGCVADYDLAFANQKQSLVVEDRSGSSDTGANATGMMSVAGVTQVTPIEQLNSKSARIGTTAATPADGALAVSGSVEIGGGQNLTWGGVYGAGIPTLSCVSGGSARMAFYPAGSTSGESMRIDSAGQVGLAVVPNIGGLDASNTIFSIKGKAAAYSGVVELANFGTSDNGQTLGSISYYDNTTKNAEIEVARESAADDAKMVFKTKPTGGSLTNRLTIDSAGLATFAGNVQMESTLPVLHLDGAGGAAISSAIYFTEAGHNAPHETGTGYAGSIEYDGAANQLVIGGYLNGTAKPGITIARDTGLPTFPVGIALQSAATNPDDTASEAFTLDKYEVGLWTPSAGVEGVGDATETSADGRYTRIGNRVWVEARIVINTISGTSSSNAMEITGWPFPLNTSSTPPTGLMTTNCTALASAPGVNFITQVNAADIMRLVEDTGNGNNNASDHFQAASIIVISGSYIV